MPADIRVIRAQEFLRSTECGRLDLEESKRLLVEIALASPPSKHYDVLVDTRSAHSEMTVSDLLDLASELHGVRKSFAGKTASLFHARGLTTRSSSQRVPKTEASK